MDCVSGELLIYRVRRCPEIEKRVLFSWIRQLVFQIEQYHRCKNDQCYRYINPYTVLITKDDNILLLDMEAQSNDFVLKSMQQRAMREHFVKPVVHIKENTRIALDLYGYAKTVQFVLASMKVTPALTKWEEYRLARMIDKCLSGDSKKQYDDLKQVEKGLPLIRETGETKLRGAGIAAIAVLLLGLGVFTCFYRQADRKEQGNRIQTEAMKPVDSDTENIVEEAENTTAGPTEGLDTEAGPAEGVDTAAGPTEGLDTEAGPAGGVDTAAGPTDGLDMAEEEVRMLEQYLLRNTVKDNQEVIRQGEVLHREILRYLAAAYDREQSKERALQTYRELCVFENQREYLEEVYARIIVLERELHPMGNRAVETGKEAMERFPASEQLAKEYAESVVLCIGLNQEEKMAILQILTEDFPMIKESESYIKWESEQKKEKSEATIEQKEKESEETYRIQENSETEPAEGDTQSVSGLEEP